jgi:ketosteroid isomerase-like protein
MHTKLAVLLAALFVAVPCYAAFEDSPGDDTQAVEQAAAQFYKSLNVLFTGDATPMLQVWSHADDVTYMGPAGGFQVGWDQVRGAWESQAALKLGGNIEANGTHVTVSGNLACVQCYEVGDNLNAEGGAEKVSIRATNLFRKENGAWKMIGHHTDLLPFLQAETVTTAAE